MTKIFAFLLLALGLFGASPVAAQSGSEPDYVVCFDKAAPADIAALNLMDYLADLDRVPRPSRDFWTEFEGAWSQCAEAGWSEDAEQSARSYVMNLMGLRGSTEKIAGFGISDGYLDHLTEMGRFPSDDGIWTDEVEARYGAEVAAGAIDDDEAHIFVEVVVLYVGSLRDLAAGPPAL